jgi:hypothetical protein
VIIPELLYQFRTAKDSAGPSITVNDFGLSEAIIAAPFSSQTRTIYTVPLDRVAIITGGLARCINLTGPYSEFRIRFTAVRSGLQFNMIAEKSQWIDVLTSAPSAANPLGIAANFVLELPSGIWLAPGTILQFLISSGNPNPNIADVQIQYRVQVLEIPRANVAT